MLLLDHTLPMNCTDIELCSDGEIVYVHNAVVSVLAKFLAPSFPWVWVLGHRPNRYMQWWDATLPLNSRGTDYSGSIRDLCFDLQLPTHDFMAQATGFDDHGLVLIQSDRPMADTLSLHAIPDAQQNAVLKQNGATLRIYLPHAHETAQVQSFTKGYLATIVGQ